MRLWSIHPGYLDAKGLVALWREGLLAQSVLQGNTKGYQHHPQLIRFKNTKNSVGSIATYLRSVFDEADNRGYSFDKSKIAKKTYRGKIPVTRGQIGYEFTHLLKKLSKRNPELYVLLHKVKLHKVKGIINPHPIFIQVKGDVEDWEVI